MWLTVCLACSPWRVVPQNRQSAVVKRIYSGRWGTLEACPHFALRAGRHAGSLPPLAGGFGGRSVGFPLETSGCYASFYLDNVEHCNQP